jgi:type IV pilus assembly protein PilX
MSHAAQSPDMRSARERHSAREVHPAREHHSAREAHSARERQSASERQSARQSGLVLISSLLLLLVVTILAVAMFRSFGLDEKIAGNVREKGRALHAAESAQQYAEWWLSQGNGGTGITCTGVVPAIVGQVCANPLANVTTVPWLNGNAPVGVTYTPPNMVVTTTGAAGTYYASPVFYIRYLGLAPGGFSSVYQIDAVGYGGSPSAVAVVESFYSVSSGVKSAED